jgi:putative transposase
MGSSAQSASTPTGFSNLEEAKRIIEAWRREYNVSRPHRALDDRTPEKFASQIAARRDLATTQTS